MKNASVQRPRGLRNGKGNWIAKQPKGREVDPGLRDVMKMIYTITSCLASFTQRFESHNSYTQSSRDITPNACVMWVKKGTHAYTLEHVHALIFPIWCDIVWLCTYVFIILACFYCFDLFFFFNALSVCSFWSIFTCFVSKIPKHIKSRKSKKFDWHFCVLSYACFALYLHTNGFVHLRA